MRIVAISYGTEGDTRPFIALCRALIEAGHDAILLSERSGANQAVEAKVPFRALAGDIRAELTEGPLAKRMREGSGTSGLAKALASIAEASSTAWMSSLVEEASKADALLFSGLTSYVALSVAEHLRVPAIGVGLQPIMPTREFPSPFLPWRVPGCLNQLSHRLGMATMWRAFRKATNVARQQVTGQPLREHAWRGYPILFGISPTLVPQPSDWPGCWRIVGDWPLGTASWEPPRPLAEFLAAGEPPIYVGFGSMAGFDRSRMLSRVISAVDGRRALLFSGWAGFDDCRLPDNILPIGPAPHDRLFPMVSMVVHHGGAGTSHSAARAGVPSVVVPFGADQFFWARRLTLLGVSPQPVPQHKLDSRTLQSRIEEASSEAMRRNAARVGQAIRNESGLANTCRAIERLARSEQSIVH